MKRLVFVLVVGLLAILAVWPGSTLVLADDATTCDDAGCHQGIEDISDPASGMYLIIQGQGGCTACHGGDGTVITARGAHSGTFYPDPGSLAIVDQTCGKTSCHPGYAYRLERSLMNTEAGKIQGNTWAWGIPDDYAVRWGNYDAEDTDGPTPSVGTKAYREYMTTLVTTHPDVFPSSLERMPAPTLQEILANPQLAAFTYQQHDCQRCHLGVKGRATRGDYRGLGCSACHIPYFSFR